MRAFSVGFSSDRVDIIDDQVILRDNTLYEISTVSVPANQMALAKSKGLVPKDLDTSPIEGAAEKIGKIESIEVKANDSGTETVTITATIDEKDKKEDEPVVEVIPAVVEDDVEDEDELEEVDQEEVVEAAAETIDSATKAVVEIVEKEGRVLSKKNRNLVQAAADSLNALLTVDQDEDEDKDAVEVVVEKKELQTSVSFPSVKFPKKKTLSNRSINRAMRQLAALKRKE